MPSPVSPIGDVRGPASAADGHLAVFNGTTGKLLKDGGAVPSGGGGGITVWDSGTTYNSGDLVLDRGGTWQSTSTNTNSQPTITNTDWTHISGDIDLGILNVSDFLTGPQTLIPYIPGCFVKAIKFLPDAWESPTGSTLTVFSMGTPITWPQDSSGYGGADLMANVWHDTGSTISKDGSGWNGGIDINEIYAGAPFRDASIILDQTPLMAALWGSFVHQWWAPLTWTPSTKVALNDYVIGNGHVQQYTTGGITGSTEPDWDISSGTTDDGTAQVTDAGDASVTGKIHASVEVVHYSDVIMPKPTALEITQQPTDVVAGAVITPAVSVRLLDQFGQPIPDPPQVATVLVSILGAGTLNGSIEKTTDSNGVAVFDDLSITEPGNGYILQFSAIQIEPFVPRVNSDTFNVTDFPITAINQLTKTITVSGDASSLVSSIVVAGSTGNDGAYTVVSAIFSSGHTNIVVVEAIPSAVADGWVQD